jgi:hypothetical protein
MGRGKQTEPKDLRRLLGRERDDSRRREYWRAAMMMIQYIVSDYRNNQTEDMGLDWSVLPALLRGRTACILMTTTALPTDQAQPTIELEKPGFLFFLKKSLRAGMPINDHDVRCRRRGDLRPTWFIGKNKHIQFPAVLYHDTDTDTVYVLQKGAWRYCNVVGKGEANEGMGRKLTRWTEIETERGST